MLSSIFEIDSKFSSTAVQSVDFTAQISTILDIIQAECWVSHEFRKKFATGKFRSPVECHLIVLPSNSFNPSPSPVDNSVAIPESAFHQLSAESVLPCAGWDAFKKRRKFRCIDKSRFSNDSNGIHGIRDYNVRDIIQVLENKSSVQRYFYWIV